MILLRVFLCELAGRPAWILSAIVIIVRWLPHCVRNMRSYDVLILIIEIINNAKHMRKRSSLII